MANKIMRIPNRETDDFVTRTSRYADSVPLYYMIGDMVYLTFNTYKKKNILETPKDKYTLISASTEYRPDIVSQQSYGTPDFWWKILEANGIKDIFDLKAGLTIRLPSNIF